MLYVVSGKMNKENRMKFDWKDQKAIVYGGGGFLGSAIVKMLHERKCGDIRVFARGNYPGLEAMGVKLLRGDIRDAATVEESCKGCTIVFHAAAKTGVWGAKREFYGINYLGTGNVIKACQVNKVPYLIYTSSPSVAYSGADNVENINEEELYLPKYATYYPWSKALAEEAVLDAASDELKTVAIRPHLIWGPEDPHLLPRILDRARKGRLVRVGDGENLVDLTYVDNAAAAHLQAAEALHETGRPNGNAYFVSDNSPVILWDWINNLLEQCNYPRIKKFVSYETAWKIGVVMEVIFKLLPFAGEPPMTRFVAGQLAHSHYFDISAAEEDFDYHVVIHPEEALQNTITWFGGRQKIISR